MFIKEVQLSREAITKLKKKYPNFSFSILYLYTTPNTSPVPHIWDILYMFAPCIPDNWQWNIAQIQLKGDFPTEYGSMINTTRNICIQLEDISMSSKIKDTLIKVSIQTKKPSDKIGDLNKIIFLKKVIFYMMIQT